MIEFVNREIYAPTNTGMSHPKPRWRNLPVKLDSCTDQPSTQAVDAHETDRASATDTETEHYWSSEATDYGSDTNSKRDLSVQLDLVKGFGEEAQVRRSTRRPETPIFTGKEEIKEGRNLQKLLIKTSQCQPRETVVSAAHKSSKLIRDTGGVDTQIATLTEICRRVRLSLPQRDGRTSGKFEPFLPEANHLDTFQNHMISAKREAILNTKPLLEEICMMTSELALRGFSSRIQGKSVVRWYEIAPHLNPGCEDSENVWIWKHHHQCDHEGSRKIIGEVKAKDLEGKKQAKMAKKLMKKVKKTRVEVQAQIPDENQGPGLKPGLSVLENRR